MNWTLDHVGHAAPSLEPVIELYTRHFGFQVECRETLAAESVDIVFLRLANTLIEVIAPLAGNKTLQKFLDTRGPGLHHVCYEVSSVNDELKRLESQGFVLIDQKARKGSRGMDVAFLHPRSCGGVLVELCSKP